MVHVSRISNHRDNRGELLDYIVTNPIFVKDTMVNLTCSKHQDTRENTPKENDNRLDIGVAVHSNSITGNQNGTPLISIV